MRILSGIVTLTELDVAIFLSSQEDPMLRPTAASLLGCEIVGNYR